MMRGRSAESPRMQAFGKTDTGRMREHNEDRFLIADLTDRDVSGSSTLGEGNVGERGSLFIVADGMGGAAAGERASEMATQTIHSCLSRFWSSETERTLERFADRLKQAVEIANDHIHAYAWSHPELRGMGTTATAAGVLGDDLCLAHVGDSRAYLVRDKQAHQLTKDHSLVQRLIDSGELTEQEAMQSKRRHIILQALGPEQSVKVDVSCLRVRSGDTLVLCSDGLSSVVRPAEITDIVVTEPGLAAACDKLIFLANERGGRDNVTVILVRLHGLDVRPAAHG